MTKQFKIYFTNSEQATVVTAHHFAIDVTGTEMAFFKDEKKKDDDIFVRLNVVAAIVPFETKTTPGSRSISAF